MKPEITPLQSFMVIGASTLLWPLIHYLVFLLRFGGAATAGPFMWVFAPMGAIAGGFLAYWLQAGHTRQGRLLVVLGYLVASPLAFIGSLGGGLFFQPLVGVTVFGALPLVLGTFFGYVMGRRFTDD